MKGKVLVLVVAGISLSLVFLMLNPALSSMQEESYKSSSIRIGKTDATLNLPEEIQLYTNQEHMLRIMVENSGENNLSYFTSLSLVGPEEIDITSWGKSTFSIPPGDSYEFIFLLEGLEPGEYELTLTAEEDFYAAITLIEDVLRLGILGFLPNLRMVFPYLMGLLPFGAEMFLYLIISDMWAPLIDRLLSIGEELPTVINSITYALLRELDTLLIPISSLLVGIVEDLPSTARAWIDSLPESIALLEPVLVDGLSYSIAHAGSFLAEGYSPMIERLPEVIDGLLETGASLRFWGPNTAAISLENLLKIWEMEDVSLAEHLLAGIVCLLLAGLYSLLTPWGLIFTPLYILYHEIFLTPLKFLFSLMYNLVSPILHMVAEIINGALHPVAGMHKWIAGEVLPLIFLCLVMAAKVIAWATAAPVETLLYPVMKGFSNVLEMDASGLNSFCSDIAAPPLEGLISFLWKMGATFTPVPVEAERGKEIITIKVYVRDMSPLESAWLRLTDIWETTVGTIKGLRTGEY